MGRKEHPLVLYCQESLNFAELLDGWLFRGAGRIHSESISDMDRRFLAKSGRKVYRERYRDLYKKVEGAAVHLLIGVEHQESVHYGMPVRVMDYDSVSYMSQMSGIAGRHEERNDLTGAEKLCGFSREDRLLPVISLVLYCGASPWDGALRLHELLDFRGVPEELRGCITDYSIQVLDVCHTEDQRLLEFPADIAALFFFLKYRDDPVLLVKNLTEIKEVRSNTCDTIAECVGERRLKGFIKEENGGKVNMCKALDLLIADGEKRGEERGEKRGVELGIARERKNTERERKNTERERKRAEKAEARIRELERILRL